jgi:hypothetical protein
MDQPEPAHASGVPEGGDQDSSLPSGASAAFPDGRDGGRSEETTDALVTGAAYMALALLGALLGLIGAFAQGWMAGPVPVGAITLIVINFVVPRLAGWAMGSRMAAGLPVFIWADVAFILSVQRGEGDLIVPGTLTGYLFIVGGLVAGVVAVARTPSSHASESWLTRGFSVPRR